MNLRVPHPSRSLRRVSSYDPTPPNLFSLSCFSLLSAPLRSQRLCVIFFFLFLFAFFPKNKNSQAPPSSTWDLLPISIFCFLISNYFLFSPFIAPCTCAICAAIALLISRYVIFSFPSRSSSIESSSGARLPFVFTCSASSMSINSRAASGSITGSPVRGSAYAPSTIAALLPIIRTRFSNACTFFGVSTGAVLPADVLASAAACATACSFTSSRRASRSCSSTTSLRISPSAVNGRRSITLNPSSCLCSDTVSSSSSASNVRKSPPVYHGKGTPLSSLSTFSVLWHRHSCLCSWRAPLANLCVNSFLFSVNSVLPLRVLCVKSSLASAAACQTPSPAVKLIPQEKTHACPRKNSPAAPKNPKPNHAAPKNPRARKTPVLPSPNSPP